jgi:hypothetical protein
MGDGGFVLEGAFLVFASWVTDEASGAARQNIALVTNVRINIMAARLPIAWESAEASKPM